MDTRIGDLEAEVAELRNMVHQLSTTSAQELAAVMFRLQELNQEVQNVANVPFPDAAEVPFKDQFYAEIDVRAANGNPQVRVWEGGHMLPYGRYSWPSSGTSDLIEITGAGWLITRQAKSGPGAISVVLQATAANPVSTTHYESNICKVDYSGGDIFLRQCSFGERNFVATV